MFFNSRSLNNKVENIMSSLNDKGVDIAGFSETWLFGTNTPTTAHIKDHGYKIISDCREDRRGGGTAVVYKSCYNIERLGVNIHFTTFEFTCSKIKCQNSNDTVLGVMYRTGSLTKIFIKEIDELLAHLCSNFDNIIIGGDMNIHFENLKDKKVNQCLDIFKSYGFRQQIFEPTHRDGGTLDQVFTFSIDNILTCSPEVDPIDKMDSDHFPVYLKLSLSLTKKYYKTLTYRKFKDTNSHVLKSDICSVINDNDFSSDFGSTYKNLRQNINSILNKHAPYVTTTVSIIKDAPWFDKEYRQLRSKRRSAEKKWRKDKSNVLLFIEYKDLCAQASSLADTKKKSMFSKIMSKSNNNPRTLFSLVNKVMDRKQVKPLPDCFENVNELATEFNKFFTKKIESIRNDMKKENPPNLSFYNGSTTLNEFEPTNSTEISEIIKEAGIKTKPDDIFPSDFMKENLDILIPLFVKLVNHSLSSGSMEGLKTADIIPLLKGDTLDHNILKNFRPVSNLEFIGKLTERVVLKRVNNHLLANNLDIPEQSAYKKNNSTETLLVRITNDILIASDSKSATVVLLLDLSAAFDTVDHNLLLNILEKEIGISGTALKWFSSFLTSRTQRTRIGNATSDDIIIMFGVPQGSVLGPVLFNIYIRSIYNMVISMGFSIFGYADDHQILKVFRRKNQHFVLAEDLCQCFTQVLKWMSKYYLQMNPSKTQIIVFGPPDVLDGIRIGGIFLQDHVVIRFVSTVKNLGFLMDSSLTFERQIVQVKKNCFSTLRNISKIRYLVSRDNLKTIVNSLIVSCLDYCNVLYYGIRQSLLIQLQRIQNAASKIVMGKYKYDHVKDDLNQLHWLSVKKRIIFKIALLVYKSLHGLAPLYLQELFHYVSHGDSFRLSVPSSRTKYGSRAFSIIGPKIYNYLPNYIKNSETIQIFKQNLKTYLFRKNELELIFEY